jgi:hypothetical protein
MQGVVPIKDMQIHSKQRLKDRFKSNFQTMNKTKLCDLKIRTQELKTKTQNVY